MEKPEKFMRTGTRQLILRTLLRIFAGEELIHANPDAEHKIKIAIIGAGRVGVTLAEELLVNPAAVAPSVRSCAGSWQKWSRSGLSFWISTKTAPDVGGLDRYLGYLLVLTS